MSITRNAGATRANSTAETPAWSRARAKRLADTDGLRFCEGVREVEELHVGGRAPRPGGGEGIDHHRWEVIGAVADAVSGCAGAGAGDGDVDGVARRRRDPRRVDDVLDLAGAGATLNQVLGAGLD